MIPIEYLEPYELTTTAKVVLGTAITYIVLYLIVYGYFESTGFREIVKVLFLREGYGSNAVEKMVSLALWFLIIFGAGFILLMYKLFMI